MSSRRSQKKKIDDQLNAEEKAAKKVIDIYPPQGANFNIAPETEAVDFSRVQKIEEIEEEIVIKKPEKEKKISREIQPLEEEDSVYPLPIKKINRRKIVILSSVILGIGLLSFLGWWIGFQVLPRAKIAVETIKNKLVFEDTVTFDKSVHQYDALKRVLPAELLVFNETQTNDFIPTGKSASGAKAKGMITIYNTYSTVPQILVATTRFMTEDNKVYRLDNRIVVPGGIMKDGKLVPGTIDASVTADKPGPEYNIGPTRFSIPGFQGTPKYEKFYAISQTAMTGGSSTESKSVTQDDLKNAEKKVGDQLFQAFDNDLQQKLINNLKFLEGAKVVKIEEVKPNVKIGETTDKFKVTISGQMKVIVFPEDSLKQMIKDIISLDLSEGTELYQEPEINYENVKVNFEKGIMTAKVKATWQTHSALDSQVLIKTVQGLTLKQAKQVLDQNKAIEKVQISLWPAWVNRIPERSEKISIKID